MVDRIVASELSQVQSSSQAQADGADGSGAPEGPAHPVGLVAGTEDSTPLQFAVALDEASYLQLDDVVVTLRQVPGGRPGADQRHRHPGPGPARGRQLRLRRLPHLRRRAARPGPGDRRGQHHPGRAGDLRAAAPGRGGPPGHRSASAPRRCTSTRWTNRVPVGRGRDGAPIYVNLEFLDGTRGAHVSISGISGVATKTSFALFLLYSIFRSGVLGARAVNAKALVFSVKGEDLLFLDQPQRPPRRRPARRQYAALGLPAEPFASAGFWAPPIPDDQTGRPNVTGRTSGVDAFWWTLARVLRPAAAAVRVRRRRGRAQAVHDGRSTRSPPGCGAGRRRRSATTARCARRQGRCPPTRSSSTSSSSRLTDDDDPRRLGRAGHRHGHDQRVRPPAALVAAAAAAASSAPT